MMCLCVFVCSAWANSLGIVLSNEGSLITNLVTQGHGNDNLEEVLLYLQEYSGGAITTGFTDTIAGASYNLLRTEALFNFVVNYPVCANDDGSIAILPIYARDYFSKEGYTTHSQAISGLGTVQFTYADNSDYYIDAGQNGDSPPTYYLATTIIWAVPDQTPVPEPATLLLLGFGLFGIAGVSRRKN